LILVDNCSDSKNQGYPAWTRRTCCKTRWPFYLVCSVFYKFHASDRRSSMGIAYPQQEPESCSAPHTILHFKHIQVP
jgi:hypothetical protein